MKLQFLSLLSVLPLLALATPLPQPEAKPEALSLLGIDLPINIAPLISSSSSNPLVNIDLTQVTNELTPIVEQLGSTHDTAVQLVDAINTLLKNSGIAPQGLSLLNVIPATLSSDTLTQIGVALNQILQGIVPGQDTTNLVNTVISTLQSLLNLQPTPATSSAPAPSATAGVVPGVETLLNEVLSLLNSASPTASVSDLTASLNAITSKVDELTAAVTAAGAGTLPTATVTNLLAQLLTAVYNLLSSIPLTNQDALKDVWGPLITSIGNLVGSLSSVSGIQSALSGLLSQLTGTLSSVNATNAVGVLTNVLNSVLGALNLGISL